MKIDYIPIPEGVVDITYPKTTHIKDTKGQYPYTSNKKEQLNLQEDPFEKLSNRILIFSIDNQELIKQYADGNGYKIENVLPKDAIVNDIINLQNQIGDNNKRLIEKLIDAIIVQLDLLDETASYKDEAYEYEIGKIGCLCDLLTNIADKDWGIKAILLKENKNEQLELLKKLITELGGDTNNNQTTEIIKEEKKGQSYEEFKKESERANNDIESEIQNIESVLFSGKIPDGVPECLQEFYKDLLGLNSNKDVYNNINLQNLGKILKDNKDISGERIFETMKYILYTRPYEYMFVKDNLTIKDEYSILTNEQLVELSKIVVFRRPDIFSIDKYLFNDLFHKRQISRKSKEDILNILIKNYKKDGLHGNRLGLYTQDIIRRGINSKYKPSSIDIKNILQSVIENDITNISNSFGTIVSDYNGIFTEKDRYYLLKIIAEKEPRYIMTSGNFSQIKNSGINKAYICEILKTVARTNAFYLNFEYGNLDQWKEYIQYDDDLKKIFENLSEQEKNIIQNINIEIEKIKQKYGVQIFFDRIPPIYGSSKEMVVSKNYNRILSKLEEIKKTIFYYPNFMLKSKELYFVDIFDSKIGGFVNKYYPNIIGFDVDERKDKYNIFNHEYIHSEELQFEDNNEGFENIQQQDWGSFWTNSDQLKTLKPLNFFDSYGMYNASEHKATHGEILLNKNKLSAILNGDQLRQSEINGGRPGYFKAENLLQNGILADSENGEIPNSLKSKLMTEYSKKNINEIKSICEKISSYDIVEKEFKNYGKEDFIRFILEKYNEYFQGLKTIEILSGCRIGTVQNGGENMIGFKEPIEDRKKYGFPQSQYVEGGPDYWSRRMGNKVSSNTRVEFFNRILSGTFKGRKENNGQWELV